MKATLYKRLLDRVAMSWVDFEQFPGKDLVSVNTFRVDLQELYR